jgi:hypothetical protein
MLSENKSGITGYTDPTDAKKEMVNKFKAHEKALWDLIDEAKASRPCRPPYSGCRHHPIGTGIHGT